MYISGDYPNVIIDWISQVCSKSTLSLMISRLIQIVAIIGLYTCHAKQRDIRESLGIISYISMTPMIFKAQVGVGRAHCVAVYLYILRMHLAFGGQCHNHDQFPGSSAIIYVWKYLISLFIAALRLFLCVCLPRMKGWKIYVGIIISWSNNNILSTLSKIKNAVIRNYR